MSKKITVELGPGDDVRLGRNLQIGLCSDPACRCVHLMMADENQKPFAMVALSIDDAIAVMGDLRMYAAQIQLAELTGGNRPQKDKRDVSRKRRGTDDGEHD